MIIQKGNIMKTAKALGYLFAAEIMSLFIGLTLAGSSTTFMRLVSAVCTTGILVCLTINFAINCAKETLRTERTDGIKASPAPAFAIGGIMSAPLLISWIILKISHVTGSFDFYRWHKLLNAYFLQIYNFINTNAETASLTSAQVNLMLLLVLIPFIVFTATYFLAYKGVFSEAKE